MLDLRCAEYQKAAQPEQPKPKLENSEVADYLKGRGELWIATYIETLEFDVAQLQQKIATIVQLLQPIPEGWVTVPLKPTPEMVSAGRAAPMCATAAHSIVEDYVALYKAMLAAAPSNQNK